MKKKIVNVFLIAALFVVAVGTFVSCKDNEEDDFSTLQVQFNDLEDALEAAIEAQTDALEAAEAELQEQLTTLQTKLTTLEEELGESIDGLEDDYKELASDIADVESDIESINTAITTINTSISDLETSLSGVESSLSDVESNVSYLLTQITRLDSISIIVEALTGIDTRVTTLETQMGGLRDSLVTLWAQVYKDNAYITALESRYEADSTNVWDSLTVLSTRCDTLSEYIDAQISIVYGYINDEIDELQTALETAIAEGDEITLAKAQEYTDSIEALLQDSIDALATTVSTLSDQVAANTEAIDELTGRVSALEEGLLARYVTSIIVQGTENDCFGTFALPLGIRSNVLMGYYGSWGDVDGTFPTTSDGYNAIQDEAYLTEDIYKILVEAGLEVENYTSGEMLGLNEDNNIDAGTLYLTVNPTSVDFEDLSVSLENSKGVESGVLLEGLQESDALLTFGYTRSSDNGFYETKAYIPYANISDVKVNVESGLKSELASALKSAISGGTISFSGLIGTIYDQFNGILPALAVKTGWTDEDDDTEYSVYSEYSVAATTFQPLSFKFMQNTSYSIPTISTLSYIDLGDFDEINIELDYKPVEYTYEEQTISISFSEITINIEADSIGLAYEHPITSEGEDGNRYYEVGADGTILAVSDTLWFHTDSLTEDLEEAILQMLADMEDEINKQLNTTINELMEGIVDDIIAQINNTISEMIENINTQLDGINDLIDSFNGIQETLDSYIDLVNTYISRINTVINRINSYLTNVNHYLQVAMLYEGEDGGLGLVGNSKSLYYVTMKAGSSAVLHPTTYTAELVAPCAKKFVAVTNVYSGATDDEGALGDSNLKNLMIEANQASETMNAVLDGDIRAIEFVIPSGATSGQIFEITYAALDYSGYTSYNKYYIGVK